MNIATLLEIGALSSEIVTRSITWKRKTFDVRIKAEISSSDFEFIYATPVTAERWLWARKVSRSILLDDGPIPFEIAKTLKTSLLGRLCKEIDEVQKEEDEEKKD